MNPIEKALSEAGEDGGIVSPTRAESAKAPGAPEKSQDSEKFLANQRHIDTQAEKDNAILEEEMRTKIMQLRALKARNLALEKECEAAESRVFGVTTVEPHPADWEPTIFQKKVSLTEERLRSMELELDASRAQRKAAEEERKAVENRVFVATTVSQYPAEREPVTVQKILIAVPTEQVHTLDQDYPKPNMDSTRGIKVGTIIFCKTGETSKGTLCVTGAQRKEQSPTMELKANQKTAAVKAAEAEHSDSDSNVDTIGHGKRAIGKKSENQFRAGMRPKRVWDPGWVRQPRFFDFYPSSQEKAPGVFGKYTFGEYFANYLFFIF